MFNAITRLFSALSILFVAAERSATMLDKSIRYGEESLDGMLAEAAQDRKERTEDRLKARQAATQS